MDRDFDTFIKQHLEDLFCLAEREKALSRLKKTHKDMHRHLQHTHHHHLRVPQTPLPDCVVPLTQSHSHL